MRRVSSRLWQTFLRVFIAGCALFILGLHGAKLEATVQALATLRYSHVLLVAALMLINIMVQYRKWLYILRLFYPDIPRMAALGSVLGGFTLGLITPGRLGELGRGLFLKGLNKWQITGLAFVDKMFNNITIFFAGCLAFYYLMKYTYNLPIYVLVPYAVIALIVVIVLYRILSHPERVAEFLQAGEKQFSLLRRLNPLFHRLKNFGKREVSVVFFYSMVFYLIIFAQFFVLIEAFAPHPLLPTLAAVIAVLFSKTLLPISIGDLGIREGAAIYFLHQVGVAKAHAFDAALLLFMINILFPSVLGMVLIPRLSFLNHKGIKKHSRAREAG